jgi:radical SAM protein with 4Fe4S-binding SPASM domain
MPGCPSRGCSAEFTKGEIAEAVKNRRLLALELQLSGRCDFRCRSCCATRPSMEQADLTQQEICDVILQARELGARAVTVLGGQPTIYPDVLEVMRFARSHGLAVEMVTNGVGMEAAFARQLFEARVGVVLKLSSLNADRQDLLTGKPGSFEVIRRALGSLQAAGYPSEETLLTAHTVVSSENIDELVAMWRWLRERGISSRYEIGRCQTDSEDKGSSNVDVRRLQTALIEISDISRREYPESSEAETALLEMGCMRHRFSCLVCSQGDVVPCIGVNTAIGNIRDERLEDILKDSEILEDLRDHRHNIKGPCRSCEKAATCYGCRGTAYRVTGDYLASDPLCWENADRQDEIARLPFPAADIIPQKSPMRVVDSVVRRGERRGEVWVTVSEEMPFVGEDGVLDAVAYFEMIAQSMAAMNGFKRLGVARKATEGYVVGAQGLEVLGVAGVGDRLSISIYEDVRFGNFAIIKGTVSRKDSLLARGSIKIWHDAAG